MVHHIRFLALAMTGLALGFGTNMAAAGNAPYFGRWVVRDEKPVYSSKGVVYKTIDIAPCGKDFCGVSVDDKGTCGATLFRFFTAHAKDEQLYGHGVWGGGKKKLEVDYLKSADDSAALDLALGDDNLDLTGREGSLPSFQARYKHTGEASCLAK